MANRNVIARGRPVARKRVEARTMEFDCSQFADAAAAQEAEPPPPPPAEDADIEIVADGAALEARGSGKLAQTAHVVRRGAAPIPLPLVTPLPMATPLPMRALPLPAPEHEEPAVTVPIPVFDTTPMDDLVADDLAVMKRRSWALPISILLVIVSALALILVLL